ncbi:hypothetical protein B0H67DRAFT_484222 [Lasiosphaeris hirsuta]|uniref:DNA (cytosine-5)-methyltransferase 1 replication foci domain-containing protein n=1 Tax=Lasiosphaeris hirsuta TaxID=260670 RepID=A0AA40AQF2_9PEZI|nr:hypothetical protein B0H67DRAFT_484222 [Lasiosphaeris hirsuta]
MPRRRGASNSTVATVDDVRHSWIKETSVLKPAPADVDDSEWPTFVLTDAVIYGPDGKTMSNPLFSEKGPMVVRGNLELNDEAEITERLLKPNIKSASIEIKKSSRYSMGYGELALWVSGEAGWFEIRPAPKYEAMYLEICEAITLYYEALDVYDKYEKECARKKRKKQGKSGKGALPQPPTLDDIFLQYAIGAGDGVFRDEVEVRYRKWAPFLVAHFPKEEDVTWEGTTFANWIREISLEPPDTTAAKESGATSRHPPEIVNTILGRSQSQHGALSDRSRSKSVKLTKKAANIRDLEMSDVASSQSQSPPPRKSKVAKAPVETPVPLPVIYQPLARPAASKPPPAPNAPKPPAASKPPPAPNAPKPPPAPHASRESSPVDANTHSPVDVLLDVVKKHAVGRDLNKISPSTVNSQLHLNCRVKEYAGVSELSAFYSQEILAKLGPEWTGTPWYVWLKEVSQKPFKPHINKVEEIPGQLVRRRRATPSISTPVSQTHSKAKMRKPAQYGESDSEEDILSSKRSAQGRRSGKGAGLRLVSASKKRPLASEMDDESASGSRRGRKKTKVTHAFSDDENMEDANGTSNSASPGLDDEEDTDGKGDLDIPMPDGSARVIVHAEKIPAMSPSGPNGTWTCDQDDCGYVVRAAEEQAAQEQIQQHFRDHEARAERINLAMKESRGHLPIKYAHFPPILLIVKFTPPHTFPVRERQQQF